MKTRNFSSHFVYGVLSIASPIIAIAGIIIYQSITHAEFWGSIDPKIDTDRTAAAMMAISEYVSILFWTVIGCFIGFLLALKSFYQQQKIFGIGLLGMVVNGLPWILWAFL